MRYGIVFLVILLLLLALYKFSNLEFFDDSDTQDLKTDERTLITLRKMLKQVHDLLTSHNITYWVDGGTLLGAVRHQDIIPWDDDADICILRQDLDKFLKLKKDLYDLGLGLSESWCGYKIYLLTGQRIDHTKRNWDWKELDIQDTYDYLYPFIDVFIMTQVGDQIIYDNTYARKVWPEFWHEKQDLYPIKKFAFSNYYVNGPSNPKPYLDRGYGSDWEQVGYKSYDHKTQQIQEGQKFDLQ